MTDGQLGIPAAMLPVSDPAFEAERQRELRAEARANRRRNLDFTETEGILDVLRLHLASERRRGSSIRARLVVVRFWAPMIRESIVEW